jgi:hypothetical protein
MVGREEDGCRDAEHVGGASCYEYSLKGVAAATEGATKGGFWGRRGTITFSMLVMPSASTMSFTSDPTTISAQLA